MVQMPPDMARLIRWAAGHGLLAEHADADLGYVLHAALAAAFGPMAPKPFALLHPPRREASILGYTTHAGAALRDQAAAFAEPEVYAMLGLDRIADKPMPDRFATGQRLGFGIRGRPVVRSDRDGNRDRVIEKDVFLQSPPGSDRGGVYADWLARQLTAGGARVLRVTLDSYRRTRVQRRGSDRSLHLSEGPDANFSGMLEVTDADAFAHLLARGVGRHRAFGFGMLLLRPS